MTEEHWGNEKGEGSAKTSNLELVGLDDGSVLVNGLHVGLNVERVVGVAARGNGGHEGDVGGRSEGLLLEAAVVGASAHGEDDELQGRLHAERALKNKN